MCIMQSEHVLSSDNKQLRFSQTVIKSIACVYFFSRPPRFHNEYEKIEGKVSAEQFIICYFTSLDSKSAVYTKTIPQNKQYDNISNLF